MRAHRRYSALEHKYIFRMLGHEMPASTCARLNTNLDLKAQIIVKHHVIYLKHSIESKYLESDASKTVNLVTVLIGFCRTGFMSSLI